MSDAVYTIDRYKQLIIDSINSNPETKLMVQNSDQLTSVTDDDNVVTDVSLDVNGLIVDLDPEIMVVMEKIVEGIVHD